MRAVRVASRLQLKTSSATRFILLKTITCIEKVAGCTYFLFMCKKRINKKLRVYKFFRGATPQLVQPISPKAAPRKAFQGAAFETGGVTLVQPCQVGGSA